MTLTQRLYRPTRNTYQRLLNREHFLERKQRRQFFSQFVHQGNLVFDVGAHRGHYAETFMELGARVVAVEPNPALADEIRRHYPQITVVAKAVGAKPGTAELTLGRDTEHSTLSTEWASRHTGRWNGTVTVEVTTLAELIGAYGRPDFVKIDVEGYETEVLRCPTAPIPALCFEFQAAALDKQPLLLLHGYEFAVSTAPYELGDWGSLEDAWAVMRDFQAHEPGGSGDVFARLPLV
jgi:FkbM family methyltransferase